MIPFSQIKINMVKKHVHKQAHVMIAWARYHFGFQKSWHPKVRVCFDKRRRFSYGGLYFSKFETAPGIDIAFDLDMLDYQAFDYLEYDHYNTDPEIGSLYFLTWNQYVNAILCHELSHAVQHSAIVRLKINVFNGVLKNFNGDWQDNEHGELFQFCLREFRREWMADVIGNVIVDSKTQFQKQHQLCVDKNYNIIQT